jgi:hypothetical protein
MKLDGKTRLGGRPRGAMIIIIIIITADGSSTWSTPSLMADGRSTCSITETVERRRISGEA